MTRNISIVIAVALVMFATALTGAAEYKIGTEDVLQINFWQDSQLNTQVRVRQDGLISLDIIGEIKAAGRTTVELQDDIVRQMSRLNKRISQAVVRVLEYNSQYVFVTGQVNSPGKKMFEQIPDIIVILNEAGWISEQGDLSRVTIIRGGDNAGQVQIVDVAAAIASGNVASLPKLNPQDAIDVPAAPIGIPMTNFSSQANKRNAFYVIGAVTTPGAIRFEANVDLLEAIALAGGPTDNADLKKTRIVSKDGVFAQTTHIDLEKYLKSGLPSRYLMQKEDIVVIPARRGSFFRSVIEYATPALGALTSALLLYETLKSDDNN